MTDAGLEAIRGLPLADLGIGSCRGISDNGLRHLAVSLIKLDLSGWRGGLTEACLEYVEGMQSLTLLNLHFRNGITAAGKFTYSVASLLLNLIMCLRADDIYVEELCEAFGWGQLVPCQDPSMWQYRNLAFI